MEQVTEFSTCLSSSWFCGLSFFDGSKKITAEFIISEGFVFLLSAKMDSDDSLLLMLLLPCNSKWHY